MDKLFIGICFGLVGLMWMKMDYNCGNSDKSWSGFIKYFWYNC